MNRRRAISRNKDLILKGFLQVLFTSLQIVFKCLLDQARQHAFVFLTLTGEEYPECNIWMLTIESPMEFLKDWLMEFLKDWLTVSSDVASTPRLLTTSQVAFSSKKIAVPLSCYRLTWPETFRIQLHSDTLSHWELTAARELIRPIW